VQVRFGWTVTRNAPPASAHGDPDCHASRSVVLSQTSRNELLDVFKVCLTTATHMHIDEHQLALRLAMILHTHKTPPSQYRCRHSAEHYKMQCMLAFSMSTGTASYAGRSWQCCAAGSQ